MREMRHLSQNGLTRLALSCALLLGGHSVAVAQTTPPRLGREFEMKVNWVQGLDRGRLRLKFVRVASDSRCPEDVDCVWAGNAEVLIEVSGRVWQERRTLTLNTNAGPDRPAEARYGRYTLKLTGLAPRPRSTGKIAPGRYTATLLVSKE